MSHATYIYAIRWAWTHFLVLALAHVCLADLHVTLVILLVFELADMFDARQSTSSPGNANVPWVRTHVGCYVRYTIPFLLLKQLSLVLCFYTVMWTVCWLRNYMRSPLEAKRMFYFFEPGTSKAISWAGRHTCKKAATLTGPKSVTNFGGVFWFPRNPAYVKKHHFTRVKSKFFWLNMFHTFSAFQKTAWLLAQFSARRGAFVSGSLHVLWHLYPYCCSVAGKPFPRWNPRIWDVSQKLLSISLQHSHGWMMLNACPIFFTSKHCAWVAPNHCKSLM